MVSAARTILDRGERRKIEQDPLFRGAGPKNGPELHLGTGAVLQGGGNTLRGEGWTSKLVFRTAPSAGRNLARSDWTDSTSRDPIRKKSRQRREWKGQRRIPNRPKTKKEGGNRSDVWESKSNTIATRPTLDRGKPLTRKWGKTWKRTRTNQKNPLMEGKNAAWLRGKRVKVL